MDLAKYKELTGENVRPSQEAKVKATIKRTKSILETMLGFTLKSQHLYTEIGKTPFEGAYPVKNPTDLLPADKEEGEYKLFRYTEKDKYLHIDPFKNIYKAKLVMPLTNGEFITVIDLDNIAPEYMRGGIGKYIEKYEEWFNWVWYQSFRIDWNDYRQDAGLQLAVDADWIGCYPDDLQYLWADMVTYYSNPNRNLKSESVDGHSWSVSDNTPPEAKKENKQLLLRYAGPYGSITKNPTTSI